MTTLPNRTHSSLLVIDVQVDVVASAHMREQVIANIANLVKKARAANVPVMWVQHSDSGLAHGSDSWKIVPELQPAEDEQIIHKNFGDAFEGTTLENELAQRGIGKLYVSGAQTDWCIRSTLHGAVARGYDAVLVDDAHTTGDFETEEGSVSAKNIIAHTNTYWHWHRVPDRMCGTVTTEALDFASE